MKMGFRSIRRRILVSFVLALITFASTVGYGLHQLSAIGRELDAVNAGFLPMSKVGVELAALVRQLDRDHDRFARTGSQGVAARRANTALYRASIDDAVGRGREAANAAATGLSHPDDLEVLGRIESVLNELDEQTVSYVDAVEEWLKHAGDEDPLQPQLLADLDRRRQALAAGADLTQALVDGQISQISRRAARAQNRALAISGTLGILSLLFASVMAGLALVSLRPINSLIQQVQRVAAGDLTGRVHLQTQDEMGLLAQEFNTMAEAVKTLLGRFEIQNMKPGDIYMTNDPWIASGHLNDFLLMMPVFYNNSVVGFTSCTSHLVDLGGLGMGPEVGDIFDKGLLIPPCKLVDAGVLNTLLKDIVKANSREPIANEGDIYALIACCETGAARLSGMMEEFGIDHLDELSTYIIDTSYRGTVNAIADLPKGVWRSVLKVDGYE